MALKEVWTLSRQLLSRKADLHQYEREPWREKNNIAKQRVSDQHNHRIDWYQISTTNHIPNELVDLK
jgi:hypothetical protein